jgi:hypothetical protein
MKALSFKVKRYEKIDLQLVLIATEDLATTTTLLPVNRSFKDRRQFDVQSIRMHSFIPTSDRPQCTDPKARKKTRGLSANVDANR